jgi:hypothetical protein
MPHLIECHTHVLPDAALARWKPVKEVAIGIDSRATPPVG